MDLRNDPPPTADLVVIGGGIVGAATTFYAARSDLAPVLVEARPGLATLTTRRSTGAFRLQFDNREELDLIRQSVDLFLNFQELTAQSRYDPAIRQPGYLWLTTDADRSEYQRDLVARQHSWGQTDIELIDGREVRSRFPFVAPGVIQGRYRAGDGFLDPVAVTLGLVEGSGAPVVPGCEVGSIEVGEGTVQAVQTSLGRIATNNVVVCAGPFTGTLLAATGVNLPLTTVARHKVVMRDVPEVPADAPMTIDDDTGTHWRPALDGGAFLLYTDPATPPTHPEWEVPPDPAYAGRILDPASPLTASRIAPFWSAVWARRASWEIESGQYTMTPDHRPLIGPTGIPGLYVNSGYSGHGIMGAPAGSKHVVRTMMDPREANPFDPHRPQQTRSTDLL